MNKLLQINTVVNSRATGRIAEEIGKLAISQGWESYIAYGRVDRPSSSKLIRIGTNWDVRIHGLQTRLLDNHGFASKRVTYKLIETIKKIQPDIIHLHNIHGYYLNIEILFKFLAQANIPVVWTFHDCWPITGHCSYFSYVGCERWKKECFSCPQKNMYPASYLLDNSRNNYSSKKELFTSVKNLTIVVVSDWMKNIIHQSFLANYPTQLIYNGVNLLQFFRYSNVDKFKKQYNINSQFIILGVASIWDKRKGFDDFVKLSQLIDRDTLIVLVGLNDKQMNILPSNIIGIKRTESIEELACLYSLADLFVNPTWEDNFPTTNIEALACGTPILTYRTGGSVEAISDEVGFIVEQGNLHGILKTIDEVKRKGKEFFAKVCRERAESYYNNQQRYEEYMDLYNTILEKNSDESFHNNSNL